MTLGTLSKSRATAHIRVVSRPDVFTNTPSPLILTLLIHTMSSGTQSPPLEATGEHQPIGAANKQGQPLKEGVKDTEQRAAYFGGQKNADDVPNTGGDVPDVSFRDVLCSPSCSQSKPWRIDTAPTKLQSRALQSQLRGSQERLG
ncbi:hypothetical protein RSAG8_06495, partial [Rhizoctonia solani AG-8 WAC10335]